MPEVSCALGSYTGWNLRSPSIGAPQYLLGSTGSFIPFALTADDASRKGDDRPAVLDRFNNEAAYARCIQASSENLVKSGFLLQSDVKPIQDAANGHWDWFMGISGADHATSSE